LLDFEFWLARTVNGHFDSSCRMNRIRLDLARLQSEPFHARNGFAAEIILSHAAGHHSAVAQQAGDVGEICGSTTELFVGGKHVPQQFTEADDRSFVHF
jgi:hypothetical protein